MPDLTESSPASPAGVPLLAEFKPVSWDDWKALVDAELKGAPFEKKMFSPTYEGIVLRPLYTRAEGSRPVGAVSWPGFPPYTRGSRASGYRGRAWEVSQEIRAASPAEFNDAARSSLQRGLTALNIVLDQATRRGADPDSASAAEVGAGGLSLATLADLDRALDGIDLAAVPLFIRSGASGMPVAALLAALARRRGVALTAVQGCIEVDPLGVLAHEGRLPQSLAGAYREMAAVTAWAAEAAPRLQTLCVHSRSWHEAGGNAVQELALSMATALAYLRAMEAAGLGVDVTAPRLRFAFTVGTQFFMEIAKLRAARMLWSRLVGVLGGSAEAQRASLHVRTSLFNKTTYDPHNNLLRTTVEAFAAVLGGCDSLQVGPFDEVLRVPGEFSQRVARNQQLILRDECALTQVIDPAGGGWLVESLTEDLARKAWAVFQEIEKLGGMAAALRAGWPQREVAKVAEERLRNVSRRRDSIVGTNVYANLAETPLDVPDADPTAYHARRVREVAAARTTPENAQNEAVLESLARLVGRSGVGLFEGSVEAVAAGATLGEITRAIRIEDRPDDPVTPAGLTRAASGFERLRRAVEARAAVAGRRPMIFLANLGPLKQHKARADFSRGFFETAGFAVVSPPGFRSVADAAGAAMAAAADAVCLCSTDETYPELVPSLLAELRARAAEVPVILAGFPADQVAAHREAGVFEFIHLRADALEVLTRVAAKLGIPA